MPKRSKLKKNVTRKSKKFGLILNKVFDQYKKKQKTKEKEGDKVRGEKNKKKRN